MPSLIVPTVMFARAVVKAAKAGEESPVQSVGAPKEAGVRVRSAAAEAPGRLTKESGGAKDATKRRMAARVRGRMCGGSSSISGRPPKVTAAEAAEAAARTSAARIFRQSDFLAWETPLGGFVISPD
jgi:hypothetical protein